MDNLSYELIKNTDDVAVGYIILDGGKPWVVQREHIPHPADSMAESAQLHIDAIVAENTVEPQPSEIELLQAENQELKLAMAELAEAHEQSKLETQLALAELAESLTGGVE